MLLVLLFIIHQISTGIWYHSKFMLFSICKICSLSHFSSPSLSTIFYPMNMWFLSSHSCCDFSTLSVNTTFDSSMVLYAQCIFYCKLDCIVVVCCLPTEFREFDFILILFFFKILWSCLQDMWYTLFSEKWVKCVDIFYPELREIWKRASRFDPILYFFKKVLPHF